MNINPGSAQGLLSLYVIKITYAQLICVTNQLPLVINTKKIYKNKLTDTIRAAEKVYYHAKFEMSKYKIGKTLKVIKSIINKEYSTDAINEIKINNYSTTDEQIIAHSFINCFVNVGPNLANNIPASNVDISSYLTGSYIDSMAVHEADPAEIVSLAGSLKIGLALVMTVSQLPL